jgi:cell division protein FtsI (penicillin-binding protein 3)
VSGATSPRAATAPAAALAERRRRLALVGVVFGLAFLSVGLRLLGMVDWSRAAERPGPGVLAATANAAPTPDYAEEGGPEPAPAALAGRGRAEITDRHGVLLATSLSVPSLHADPSVIADKDEAARRFASVLHGVDAKALAERLKAKRKFAWVKHQITPQEQKAVLELGIPGIGFRGAPHRVYPKQNLTSHLLGFVDLDGRGIAGVERAMDDRLTNGAYKGSLALSLDLRVQQIVRDELLGAFTRFRAKGAAGMVLDARTGEVLAMVSLPDFDPNRPPDTNAGTKERPGTQTEEDRARLLNRVTGGTYELGSLFKIFTAAVALDSGHVRLHDSFDATEPLRIKGATIRDDHAKRRRLTVPECFMYSSNICTAKMAFSAGGAGAMDGFFRRLGFYEKPDIELPQVELGTPQVPRQWKDITVATASFGHGIAVSPFQFVNAVAGLVRGDGTWAKPTLVRRGGPGGQPPGLLPGPVGPGTVEDLRWLMWLTVDKGTGTQAKQAAYLVGGKTGTADKPKENGRGYQQGVVIASFAGVFPIEAPRYVVLAMIDEPRGDKGTHGYRYGGWTAAPVVGNVIDRIGPLLGVGPSAPEARRPFADRLQVTKVEGQREERLAAVGPPR